MEPGEDRKYVDRQLLEGSHIQHKVALEEPSLPNNKTSRRARWLSVWLVTAVLVVSYYSGWPRAIFGHGNTQVHVNVPGDSEATAQQVIRRYNLTVGARWMNLGVPTPPPKLV